MANHEFESLDVAYVNEITDRAERLRQEEDARIEREIELEQQAALREQEAMLAQDQVTEEPAATTEPEGDGAAPSQGFFSDAFAGFANGLRDAGVEMGQLGIDAATLGQSATNLDEMVPDVQDRDSTTFGVTSGLTQFATGFIPALGIMSKLGKIKSVAKGIASVRNSGALGRAFTGTFARDTAAGAIADFSVFDPHSARFSDFLNDQGWGNPITEFLQAEEDDSEVVGRIKNVVEGAGLGAVFDVVLKGIRAGKNNLKAFHSTMSADTAPDIAHHIKNVHESVIVERQALDEIGRARQSAADAGRVPTDPTVDEARAAADSPDIVTDLSPDAQAHLDSANLRSSAAGIDPRQALDEVGQPFDDAARAASPLEQARLAEPQRVADVEETVRHGMAAIDEEYSAQAARVSEAEDALAALRTSAEYRNLPPEVRAEWETIDDYQPVTPEVAEHVSMASRTARDANPVEPRAQEVQAPRLSDNPDFRLIDEAADGSVTINQSNLEAYRVELNKSGSVKKINVGRQIDVSDPHINRAITQIFAKARGNIARLDTKSIAQLRGLNNFNRRRMTGPGGFQEMADELATFVRDRMGLSARSVDNAETLREADAIARVDAENLGDPDRAGALLQNYKRAFKDKAQDLRVSATVIRIMTETARLDAKMLVQAVLNGNPGIISQADLLLAFDNFVQLQNIRDGYAAEIGRALQSFNIKVHAVPVLRDIDAAKLVDAHGGIESVINMAKQLDGALDNAAALEKTVKGLRAGPMRLRKMAIEYWLNAILSGPITQTVNVFSNTATLLWVPAERLMVGTALKIFRGDDLGLISQALRQYQGLAEGWRAAFRLSAEGRKAIWGSLKDQAFAKPHAQLASRVRVAEIGDEAGNVWKAFAANDAQLDPGHLQFDFDEGAAITSGNVKRRFETGVFKSLVADMSEETAGGRIIDWIGNAVRLPGRLLTTGDELAKSLNYHMALNNLAYEQAIAAGVDNVDQYVKQLVQDVPKHRTFTDLTDEVATTYAQLDEAALKYARKNTFTEPLAPGSFGKTIQDNVVKHPTLRFVVPFVRTPTNLLHFALDRTPLLAPLRMKYKEAFAALGNSAADTAEKAVMRGRMAIGGGLYVTAGMLAYNGVFTGAGPTNPDERRALLATGWQPNSIRIRQDDGTSTYVSYNRTDPFGLFLGMAATFAEGVGMMSDADATDVGLSMALALSETLQSKAYFQGITSLVAALDAPDRYLEAAIKSYAGSLVPNFIGSLNRTGPSPLGKDDYMREASGVLDAVMAKLPGYSKDLPPRRNIFGEPITYAMGFGPDTFSPFMTRTSADTVLNKEIQRLSKSGLAVSMNGYKQIQGVELTPAQRDRYIVLSTGDTSRNGSDLITGLTKLVQSRAYEQADDSADGKQKLIREFIEKRRERGRKALLREDAELDKAIRFAQRQARGALVAKKAAAENATATSGIEDAINSILSSNR